MRKAYLLLTSSIVSTLAFGQAQPQSNQVEVVPGVSISIPAPWFLANRTSNGFEIAYPRSKKPSEAMPEEKPRSAEQLITADARVAIIVEHRSSHAKAVEQLAEIASEEAGRPQLLTIADWPAIHRQLTAPLPEPGEADSDEPVMSITATTAIAADTLVVRFETVLAPDAEPGLAEAAFQIAKQVRVQPGNPEAARRDLETLARLIDADQSTPQKQTGPDVTRPDSGRGGGEPAGSAGPGSSHVQKGTGELEVVIAENGVNVVVAAGGGYAYSDDAGETFTHGGKTPCTFTKCDGDPSLAIGKSGAVYYSWIGFPTNEPGGTPANGKVDSLSISKDNGHNFKFLSNAVVCPATTPAKCTLPDQEHIAADRKTLSKLGDDRVYLVWRNFSSVGNTPRITCSLDGGKTWSVRAHVGAGDFPRITVGSDGFVYVAYYKGSHILLNKFSDCDDGLEPQEDFPVKVASFDAIPCPVPGLDRCNAGNTLASQMVAVDDTNPSHVYVAFATNTAANNDDIRVYDSLDGGLSWKNSPVTVNKEVPARRFLPWVCAAGGIASVTWFDRRAATKAEDDLTAYFRGSAQRVTPPGVLQANPESNVSRVNDPQCASGWPAGERSAKDATSCSTPQLAGQCRLPCAQTKPPSCTGPLVGSQTPCDLNKPGGCTVPGESCQRWGRGVPKYGDYVGNACTPSVKEAGIPTVCSVWASGTPAKGVDVEGSGIHVYASCAAIDSTAPPVTIHYRQVGACNGYNGPYGLVSAGTKFAYVIFRIESIDNSLGSTKFAFDPANLYYQQARQDFFDPGLGLYKDVLSPDTAAPTSVPAGDDRKFPVRALGALVVTTKNANGAIEANETSYFLLYDRQPGDLPVKLVKSDAKQTEWANTEDCKKISLH